MPARLDPLKIADLGDAPEPGRLPPPVGNLWQTTAEIPVVLVPAVEAALEPFASALSSFEIPPGDFWMVEAITEGEPDLAAMQAAVNEMAAIMDAGAVTLDSAPLQSADWVVMSQGKSPPVRAGRFYLHGTHDRGTAPFHMIAFEINAGLAFGTGQHATTKGCLQAIDRLKRQGKGVRHALDVGCGTGVLAMAMRSVWKSPVTTKILASDIDAIAVATTRQNLIDNQWRWKVHAYTANGLGHGVIRRNRPYDVITANILADPLCAMAKDMVRLLAPKGVAVLSGLLAKQQRQVLNIYRQHGMIPQFIITDGDWRILTLVKP